MERTSGGRYRFSFSKFINNAVPSMMIDSAKDPGHISLMQKDMIYDHQSYLAIPYALNEGTLEASMIVDTKSVSKQAFKGLQKAGVVSSQGLVDTTKIDRNFTHHVAIVGAYRQKQIIDMLFWWEEETMRLKKLFGERQELEGLLSSSSAAALPTYSQLLDRVHRKIKAKPSERDAVTERDEDELMVRVRSGGMAQPQQVSQGPEELPPAYAR